MPTEPEPDQSRALPSPQASITTSRGVQILTTNLPHHPPDVLVHLALFRHVKNAADLRSRLRAGDAAFEYAFVDAATLLSTTHLLAAIFRAINDATKGRLRTHNVHAETVLCMNASNNIGDSFRRFGLSEATTSLAVAKISGISGGGQYAAQDLANHLGEFVAGESVPFCDSSLAEMRDLSLIRKIYKVGPATANSGADPSLDSENEESRLEAVVVGLMALRGG